MEISKSPRPPSADWAQHLFSQFREAIANEVVSGKPRIKACFPLLTGHRRCPEEQALARTNSSWNSSERLPLLIGLPKDAKDQAKGKERLF